MIYVILHHVGNAYSTPPCILEDVYSRTSQTNSFFHYIQGVLNIIKFLQSTRRQTQALYLNIILLKCWLSSEELSNIVRMKAYVLNHMKVMEYLL